MSEPVQSCHGRDCHTPGCPSCVAVLDYYERMHAADNPEAAKLAWYQAALRSTMRRLVRSNQVGARVAELADAEVDQLKAEVERLRSALLDAQDSRDEVDQLRKQRAEQADEIRHLRGINVQLRAGLISGTGQPL